MQPLRSFPFTPRSVHDTLFYSILKRTLHSNKKMLYKGPLHRKLYVLYCYFIYHAKRKQISSQNREHWKSYLSYFVYLTVSVLQTVEPLLLLLQLHLTFFTRITRRNKYVLKDIVGLTATFSVLTEFNVVTSPGWAAKWITWLYKKWGSFLAQLYGIKIKIKIVLLKAAASRTRAHLPSQIKIK